MTKVKEIQPIELKNNSVSKTLNKISLSGEFKNLLTLMGGSLQVTFDPAAQQPIIRVLDVGGKTLCSIGELEKLSGYHRFLADAVKTAEKESSADMRLALTAKLMALQGVANVPEKIIQENHSKKIELEAVLKRIKTNIDKIKDLANHGSYKDYLLSIGDALESVLVNEMISLVGPEKITKDMRIEAIFDAKIPHWCYGKFISNDWIKNETVNVKALIFPKNNFLKGISFSTKEMMDEDFVDFNRAVMTYSGHLPVLVNSALVKSMLGVAKDAASNEVLEKCFENFMWVLHDGESAADIIQPRIDGKTPPEVSIIRLDKGKEGELPRLKRDMLNRLTQLSHYLSMFMHGLVLTEDALNQFWAHVYAGATQWDITPAKNLYDWIKEDDVDLEKFEEIVHLKNKTVNKVLIEILFVKLELYDPKLKSSYMAELMDAATKVVYKPKAVKPRVSLPQVGMADVNDITMISDAQRKNAKRFLGIKDKKFEVKKGRQNARRLSKKVLAGLSDLCALKNGKHLSDQVKNWLETSFTTSEAVLQEIALEWILAAAGRVDILDNVQEEESDDTSDDE